jgi:tRNA A37 methylthiotransferase MiaB
MPSNSSTKAGSELNKDKKSVCVITNGCHESFIDATMLEQYFREQSDFLVVKDIVKADLIVLLGCSVMQPKEDQTRELIKSISEQKRPDAELLIAGCIAKVRPEIAGHNDKYSALFQEIQELLRREDKGIGFKANFPYRPYRDNREDLLGITRTRIREKKLLEYTSNCTGLSQVVAKRFSSIITCLLSKYGDFIESRIDVWNDKTYTIKISTGCCGNCSYCSIKQSRGKISSRSIADVVRDFKDGLEEGYKEFALIGTDIGDFGKDRGEDLLDLLYAVLELCGECKLRLRNLNPRWLIPNVDSLCDLLKSKGVVYIESPIQSCSNHILRLMNRGYKAEDYFDAMRKIRHACPNVFLKTQAIVGFPGESDEDFKEFLKLYESKLFNYVDVFPYTNRPNTEASIMPNQVPNEIIMKRRNKLLFKSLFQLAPRQLLFQWLGRSQL